MENVAALEKEWNGWIVAGSQRIGGDSDTLLVGVGQPKPAPAQRPRDEVVVRGQTPEATATAAARPAQPDAIPLPRTDRSQRDTLDVAEANGSRPNENALSANTAAFAGEQQAVNRGWAAIDGDLVERLPRPRPLDMRVELDTRRENQSMRQ
jgi:hypothetical protein